jgi:hypothetical protein
MSTDVKITYINKSRNDDNPTIFVFTRNVIPTFEALVDGIAWRIMPNIGQGSSSQFYYPIKSRIQASWEKYNFTNDLNAEIGKRYTVEEDDTGIVLIPNGNACQKTAIEINNNIRVNGGIKALLKKENKVIVTKNTVAYGQKATFILHPKLYWGIASEIHEGQELKSAILNTDHFFEQDIEGVSEADVILRGNPKEGYQFCLENEK